LAILPTEFTRQLNPAGRRLLANTPILRIPGGTSYAFPGLGVLVGHNAPNSTIVHEAIHILNVGGRLSPTSPPEFAGALPATQFYTAGVHVLRHLPRLAISPRWRRDEVLASGVQRTNITGQPLSGLGQYGWTPQLLTPLTRYFFPTSLGLGGGIRSAREERIRTGWR
jgi:hypothetical protein